MKCHHCVKQGLRSKVYIGQLEEIRLDEEKYYDEDGNLAVQKERRRSWQDYKCSEGHAWRVDKLLEQGEERYGFQGQTYFDYRTIEEKIIELEKSAGGQNG